MAVIHLQTEINAPTLRVFDLARSVEVHQVSVNSTHERAVAGVVSGLMGPGDEVTWEARHLGFKQRLCVRITAFERPRYFQDVMVTGAFRDMKHDHRFEARDGRTVMSDRFEFDSPFGVVGSLFDRAFLAGYMRRFLQERNAALKRIAESEEWRDFLGE